MLLYDRKFLRVCHVIAYHLGFTTSTCVDISVQDLIYIQLKIYKYLIKYISYLTMPAGYSVVFIIIMIIIIIIMMPYL